MYLLLAVILVVLELTYEGLKFKGKTTSSEFLEMLFLGVVYLLSFFWITASVHPPQAWQLDYPHNLWKIGVGVISFRFGCFDTLLNVVRGKKWFYVGTAKVYDRTVQKILNAGMPIGFFRFIQFLFFIFGSLILLYGNTDKILN